MASMLAPRNRNSQPYPYPLYITKRNRTPVSSAPPKGITGAGATVSKHCMWDPQMQIRDTLKPIFDDTKKQRRSIHGIGRPFFIIAR